MPYTSQEYTDMILCYGMAGENSSLAERLYAERFPKRQHPSKRTIMNCVQRTKETGCVGRRHTEGTGYRSLKDEEEILREYTDNPGISFRQLARKVGVCSSTVHRVIQDEGLQKIGEMNIVKERSKKENHHATYNDDQDEMPLSMRLLQALKKNAKRRRGSRMQTRQKWKLKEESDKNRIKINKNEIDENQVDENQVDENHINENHIDENQIEMDQKLFEPEFIDCGS